MPANARFCPGCGIPRTHVRQELERASATTGIPYERLLEQAREQDARQQPPLPAPTSEPAEPVATDARRQIGVVITVLLAAIVVGIIVFADPGNTDEATPTATMSNRDDAQIATAIRDELSGFRGTTWHANIDSLAVTGATVKVWTELDNTPAGKELAEGVCMGVSGTVFRNDRRYWGIETIRITGRGNALLVERDGQSDDCNA